MTAGSNDVQPTVSVARIEALAEEVARDVLEGRSAEWDEQGRWPAEGVHALQRNGLGALMVSRVHDGLGHGLLGLCRVCETLGRADASTGLCFGMHSVATQCLEVKATADQVERFVAPIAAGRHWTTLALSEPGTGSHFYLPETTMEATEDGYVLRGAKAFVTSGGHADSYVVSTRAPDPEALAGHFSLVAAPAAALERQWGAPWAGWGMRANASRSVDLDGVTIARANLLGEEGDQICYVFNIVAPVFLIAMAGTYVGVATRAFDEATAHLQRRSYSHSGGSLSSIAVLQHRVGEVWGRLQATRALCQLAARQADGGHEQALPNLCAAKASAARMVTDVVGECMTLVGGTGYRGDGVLPRLMRDGRAAHVMSPTTDLLYAWAGRALLGQPLLTD